MSDLRQLADPQPRGVFGLPQLDRLFEVFRFPILETTAQDSRWTSPPSPPDEGTSPSRGVNVTPVGENTATLPFKDRRRPSVVQLTDKTPTGGKTSLCYLITIIAVLPQDYNGKEHAVIWLDTDARFSAVRLQSVLIHHLSNTFPGLSSSESNAICHEALRHVHLFRPQSSSQLVATLVSLPGYLLGTGGSSTHFSASRSLGLLVLDSATAFYQQDCFEAEIARFEALRTDDHAGTRSSSRLSRTSEVIAELKRLQKLFDCTILFTSTRHEKSSTMNAAANIAVTMNDGWRLPQEAPRISLWVAFATLTLSVSQDEVRQFAVQLSLDECHRDQPNRLAAVTKRRSIVSVDWRTSDIWPIAVQDALNRLDGQGSFAIRLTSSSIDVEE